MQSVPSYRRTREDLGRPSEGNDNLAPYAAGGQSRPAGRGKDLSSEARHLHRRGDKRHSPAPVLGDVYEPIREGLERVNDNLRSLTGNESRFLAELLAHVLAPPGKGVRPALTLLAAGFHPSEGRKAELMASAVELLHIATLIHDDTVDDSDLRRGRATVSRIWGRNAAVLLGDYVFAISATLVSDIGNIRVIRRFAETLLELSSGELREMADAHDWRQTREQYLHRIYRKTASLFTAAGEAGAVLSGAPEQIVQALKEYSVPGCRRHPRLGWDRRGGGQARGQ